MNSPKLQNPTAYTEAMAIWRSERREKERQARSDGRMPPGQSLTEKFPVLTYESASQWPSQDLTRWSLDVYGAVGTPLRLDIAAIEREFEVVDLTFDIHCVTRWSKLDTTWHGVRIRDIINRANPEPAARFLVSHASTGYTANVPIDNAIQPASIIAWKFNGTPIPPDHGGPVRAIVDPERLYFWKSTKFLAGLELSVEDMPGFWERLGYHNRGDIWAEERFWQDSDITSRRQVVQRAGE